MVYQRAVATPRVAGMLLGLSSVANMAGVVMFNAREGTSGKPASNFAYFVLERSLLVGGAVIAALGLATFAGVLAEAHCDIRLPARAVAATYAASTVALAFAEVSGLRSDDPPYVLIVVYVVAAFLTQATFGVILLRTGFLSAWIGWAAIVWNLGWFAALAILTPRDIYFPILHHAIPLLFGIALLRWGR